MDQPQASSVRRAFLWRAGGQGAAQVLLWSSTFIVLRLLSPADYGLVAMAGVLTGFLALLSGQGFTAALIQAPTLSRENVRRFLGLLVLVNLGLAALQLAAAPTLAAYYHTPEITRLLRVQALAYLFIPWIAVPAALAQRDLNFRTPALIDLGGSIVGALATLTLAFAHAGVWALIAGQFAPMLARAIVWTARLQTPRPSFGLRHIVNLAHFGGAVTLNGVLWFLYAQADIMIAGRRLSAHGVGLYSTALFLAALPVSKLIPVLTDVGLSAYARRAHDRAAVEQGFLKVTRLVSLIAFPIFIGLAAIAPTLVPALLGTQWIDAIGPVRLLALTMPLYAVTNLFGPAVNALGRPKVQLGNAVFGLLIMPAAFWIGSAHGALGIAAAWAIAYPALFLISAVRSLGVIGPTLRALGNAIGPALVACAPMAAAALILAHAGLPAPASLAAQILAGALVYIATVAMVFPHRLREAWALLRPQAAI